MDRLLELFHYGSWATLQLIEFCGRHPPQMLDELVAGTDRSILHTLTHLVGSEQSYLERLAGKKLASPVRQGEILTLPEVRLRSQVLSEHWQAALDGIDQIDLTLPAEADYPATPHAQDVLAMQAIQHGIDHRTQICTTVTLLGLQPPEIDLWSYWLAVHLGGS